MSRFTWKKKLVFSLITLVLSFLILELSFRLFFSFYVGPSAFLYGTPYHRHQVASSVLNNPASPEAKTFMRKMTEKEWDRRRNVEIHPNERKGYSKYFPHQKRVDFDVDTGKPFSVSINGRGFRGKDFAENKQPGVIRVVCLGASSTFGYFDRDNETYPVYLEQQLNRRYDGRKKFEVINLGIPHLPSWQIYNLFMAEGVQLNPDIVTFYEGNNDSDPPQRWLEKSLVHAALKKIALYSMVAKFVDSISSRYIPILYPSMADPAVTKIRDRFIDNVSRINDECKKRGILFIVANQQRNSQAFDREELKGMTYREEVAKIQKKLDHTGALLHPELALLIHSVLMQKEREWATANQVPFVDVIARLDQDRDVLVSWVHLSARGNRMVAGALADKILEYNWTAKNRPVLVHRKKSSTAGEVPSAG